MQIFLWNPHSFIVFFFWGCEKWGEAHETLMASKRFCLDGLISSVVSYAEFIYFQYTIHLGLSVLETWERRLVSILCQVKIKITVVFAGEYHFVHCQLDLRFVSIVWVLFIFYFPFADTVQSLLWCFSTELYCLDLACCNVLSFVSWWRVIQEWMVVVSLAFWSRNHRYKDRGPQLGCALQYSCLN